MAGKKRVRVAVIGLGMGRSHLEVLSRNLHAEITVLCDLKRDLARSLADQYKVPGVCADYRDLLRDPGVEAAIVALPVFLHAPVSLDLLKAGKHVLVEKPMAATSRQAEAMLAAARRKKVVLTINHNQRFDPATVFLKQYIAEGNLGAIHFARCVWSRPYGSLPGTDRNWFNEKDKGGGVLFDLGTHLLDKVMSLLGFPEPVQFAASSFTVLGKDQERQTGARFDADDLTVGMIQFANGLTLQLETGFASHIERDTFYFELYGSKGGASSSQGGLKLFTAVQGRPFVAMPTQGLPAPAVPSGIDDFVDAIRLRRKPVITPESGIQVMRVLEGLREAAANGWGRPRSSKRGARA